MIGLLGKKLGMSQIFMDDGKVIPVSLINAGPCPVVQIKTKENDGYQAIQIGMGERKHVSKPMIGHLKKANLKSVKKLSELKPKDLGKYKVGDRLDVTIFAVGDKVSVAGWTKGRGFSGGIKRWGWHGGPATHGSMSHRRTGSNSSGSDPGRVRKGKKLAGRYGNERVTTKNLKVVKIEKEKNLIYLKGAIPGAKNGYIIITKED
jgi:large subunit ribosomal protein L3